MNEKLNYIFIKKLKKVSFYLQRESEIYCASKNYESDWSTIKTSDWDGKLFGLQWKNGKKLLPLMPLWREGKMIMALMEGKSDH